MGSGQILDMFGGRNDGSGGWVNCKAWNEKQDQRWLVRGSVSSASGRMELHVHFGYQNLAMSMQAELSSGLWIGVGIKHMMCVQVSAP